MPEVTQEPTPASLIEKNAVIGQVVGPILKMVSSRNPDGTVPSYDVIRGRAEAYKAKVRAAVPNLPDNEFEGVANLFFGPWLLPEQKLTTDRATQQEKELNARLQHEFAHLVVYSQSKNAPEKLQARVWGLMKHFEDMADGPVGKTFSIGGFLSGIRAETGIIRTLLDGGFRVFVPDYEQASDFKSGKYSETYEWDVQKGIDLVAISPRNETFLIDAKGRAFDDDVVGHRQVKTDVTFDGPKKVGDIARRIPQSLKDRLIRYQKNAGSRITSIKDVTVWMPSSSEFMGRLGRGQLADGSTSYGDALNRFGRLNEAGRNAIMSRLNQND